MDVDRDPEHGHMRLHDQRYVIPAGPHRIADQLRHDQLRRVSREPLRCTASEWAAFREGVISGEL
ncbi:hypothetical protein ACFFS2_08405 [Streptomyces aurantiacus]|uniref:DUF397 domain-containing protein n=1 Tax=Streptomyces aurantiacus TaxID=47760 RepID=A0A7G1PCU1_9ACTN|nr:hypothetical protein [Streptomyces aurantiacus]BCL31587.1 hypothetical protein GCM10017557_64460 [Streptomyces aurantiacus]